MTSAGEPGKLVIMLTKEQMRIIGFGLAFLVICSLGIHGFAQAFPQESWANICYYTLQLFALQPPSENFEIGWSLNIARFGAPMLLAYSTIGLFIYASGKGARGWMGLRLNRHILIFGSDDLAVKQSLLIKSESESEQVVLVAEEFTEQLALDLGKHKIQFFCFGSETLRNLRKLKVQKARAIYLMHESEEMQAAYKRAILEILGPSSSSLVLVRGNHHSAEETHLPGKMTVKEFLSQGRHEQKTRVIFFDPYHLAAQRLLTDFGPHLFIPQAISQSAVKPHLVVFGMGSLAQAWIKVALSSCHFRPDEKLRMTVFYDSSREEEAVKGLRKKLSSTEVTGARRQKIQKCHQAHYPDRPENDFLEMAGLHAARYLDVHFEPVSFQSLESDMIEDVIKERVFVDEKAVIYVAHDQDSMSLETAKVLDGDYQNIDHIVAKCIVCVQEVKPSSLRLSWLAKNSDFMMAFPIEEAFRYQGSPDKISSIEECARKLHMAYLESPESQNQIYGEKSFMSWEDLPEDKKASNRAAILHFYVKAALFGFGAEKHWDPESLEQSFRLNREALTRLEHQRWEAHHFVEGWKLGVRFDKDRNHPSLVPFDWLSQSQKDRDEDQIFAVLRVM